MKRLRKVLIIIMVVIFLSAFIFWQNNDLTISKYSLSLSLDDEVNIVHLSDLHSKSFGENNDRLLDHVKDQSPDIIVMTGDLIDKKDKVLTNQLDYLEALTDIAPVYVVSGNHEYWSGQYDEFVSKVESFGAILMDNKAVNLSINGHHIQLIGLADPESGEDIESTFLGLINESMYNIVLYHRVTMMETFSLYDVDLVFSGHTHGGQIRLPFIGGLLSPDQGWFPKYSGGLYELGETTLIHSRGLANSMVPVRVFNRPDIVSVTLK